VTLHSISHPRALTSIPDPIHGKFELNLFDRDLVDSEFFQRLHFVSQNAANYTSFPSNKNSRFPHSIGVSHVAGRMFSAALSNASTSDLDLFLHSASAFLTKLLEVTAPGQLSIKGESADNHPFKNAHFDTISGFAGFLHSPNDKQRRIDTEKPYGEKYNFKAAFVIDTFWQAIRIYGLMHDIGHLPMSHSFESAIDSMSDIVKLYDSDSALGDEIALLVDEKKSGFPDEDDNTKLNLLLTDISKVFTEDDWDIDLDVLHSIAFQKELHETRGLNLFVRFIRLHSDVAASLRSYGNLDKAEINGYSQLIQYVTLSLYFSKSFTSDALQKSKPGAIHPFSFLYATRQLVDGSTDADRFDYVLRDCHETGSKFGAFDLERIVTNSLLLMNEKKTLFNFGFHFRAISGIEQFFETRFQTYKYVVFHRTSSRTNKCLERLVALIFIYAIRFPVSEVGGILGRYGYVKTGTDGRIKRIIPDDSEFIRRIDDHTFRNMLFEIDHHCESVLNSIEAFLKTEDSLQSVSQIENLGIITGLKDVEDPQLLIDIKNLLDVVLLRDLSHVSTLKKNHALRNYFLDYWNSNAIEFEFEDFYRYAVHGNSSEMENTVTGIRSALRKQVQLHRIMLIVDRIQPKLFRKDVDLVPIAALPFEESVSVLCGSGAVKPIEELSSTLRYLFRRYFTDSEIRIYAVGRDIKLFKDEMENIDNAVETVMPDLVKDYQIWLSKKNP